METLFKCLDSTKTLNDSLPMIIEAFLEFYGEENREYITQRFNNMIFAGYYNRGSLSTLISEIENKATDEILKEILKKVGIEYTNELKKKYMGAYTLERADMTPIMRAYSHIKMFKKNREELLLELQKEKYEFAKKYIPNLEFEKFIKFEFTKEQINMLPEYMKNSLEAYFKVDLEKELSRKKQNNIYEIKHIDSSITEENIDEKIASGELDEIYKIGKLVEEGIEVFKKFSEEKLKKYKDLEQKTKDLEEKTEKSNYMDFIKEFKEYLPEEEQKKLDEMIKKGNIYAYNLGGLKYALGTNLTSTPLEAFSAKSEEKLNNPKVNDFFKSEIMKKRIEYFKYRGIDLGNDYENYKNNPECKKTVPSEEEIQRIIERKNYYRNKQNIDFYSNTQMYLDIKTKAEEKGLLDKESIIDPALFTKIVTCVEPNIIKEGSDYMLYPVVLIYVTGKEDTIDCKIIHELNHYYELALTKMSGNKYECICGWDSASGEIMQENIEFTDMTNDNRKKRKYELFSEIINELLAQRICEILHKRGVKILNNDNYVNTSKSTYENSDFIIKKFMDEFLPEIIESRKNNNIEMIWNKVGKENFENLNSLVNEFFENFPESTFYQVCNEIRNNQRTELVEKIEEIKAKRDAILESMREYSKANTK